MYSTKITPDPKSHRSKLTRVLKKQKRKTNKKNQPNIFRNLAQSLSSKESSKVFNTDSAEDEQQFNRNLNNKQIDIMVYMSIILKKQDKNVDIKTTYNQSLKQFQFTLTKTGKRLG